MGAALAFYTLFSVAPILIIALAIAGWVFGPHTAETELLAQLQALTGHAGAEALQNLLTARTTATRRGWRRSSASSTLVVGATSVFGELQHALDVIWGASKRKREHRVVEGPADAACCRSAWCSVSAFCCWCR